MLAEHNTGGGMFHTINEIKIQQSSMLLLWEVKTRGRKEELEFSNVRTVLICCF